MEIGARLMIVKAATLAFYGNVEHPGPGFSSQSPHL